MKRNVDEEIEKWMKCPDVPDELKHEILNMSSEEKEDAFGTNLAFGTAGMRGKIGAGSNRMNSIIVKRATIGYKMSFMRSNRTKQYTIVIAHDNRKNSKLFADIARDVLTDSNIRVICFESLRPTPLLSFAIRYFKANGGIVITASHNPKEYNGYKIYDAKGCQITEKKARKITECINRNPILPPFYDEYSEEKGEVIIAKDDVEEDFLYNCKKCQLNRGEEKNLKIVFTPQHGTGSVFGPRLLEECGYNVIKVEEQMTCDPEFSNTECANPEKIEAYTLALKYAKENDADAIFSTDPDADRIGVMYKKTHGEYVLLTGNEIGVLLINYILTERKKNNTLPKEGGIIFQSIVTNSLGSRIAKKYNVSTKSFLTGFKYIGEALSEQAYKSIDEFIMGYEESCGYLIKDFCRDKDAFEAMVVIAEMINHYKIENKTLDDVLEEIYQEFGYTVNINREINFKNMNSSIVSQKMKSLKVTLPLELIGHKISKVEDYLTLKSYDFTTPTPVISEIENLPSENVLKLFLDNNTHWIAIRPSGTEPKIKFYYECTTGSKEESLRLAEDLNNEIQRLFNTDYLNLN